MPIIGTQISLANISIIKNADFNYFYELCYLTFLILLLIYRLTKSIEAIRKAIITENEVTTIYPIFKL